MTRQETASLLNDLIETSHDGEQGFAKASRDIADPQLKSVLFEGALRCREGARELEGMVRELGLEPAGGSLRGAMHRGWISVREAVTRRDALAILEECERGEDYARDRYAVALEEDLPGQLREVVERQYRGVVLNHDRVRALRDAQPR